MKKLIAFLLCFTLLAVGVTYGCIQRTLRTPAAEEPIAEQGIDLNGFYDENDLIITEIKEDADNVYLSYPQFDGLKNNEVQTAINEQIRGEAERLKQQDIDAGGDIRFLSYNVSGNFANTLSVGLYSANERVYLNFNLNDGSLLQLSDLFASDADLQGIIHAAFYDAVTRGNLPDTYLEGVNYPDENELYKTVKGYLSSQQPFLFTPAEIFFYYKDYSASISMTEYAEDIVVYSKYLTEESLFENDGIGYDDVFTCAQLQQGFDQREFGFAAENFWYDVALMERYVDDTLPETVQEDFLGFYDDVYVGLRAEVDEILATAKANPDKAYIYMACPSVHLCSDSEYVGDSWEVTPSVAAEVNFNYRLYEMSMEAFETKYLSILRDEYRSGNYYLFYGGIDDAIDSNEVLLDKRESAQLYNYQTGELLTLDEVFADGYDYMDAIRRNLKYTLTSHYGYTLESAETALQDAWCEIEGSGVRVYISEWGTEQYLTMSLSDFPRSGLAIYE